MYYSYNTLCYYTVLYISICDQVVSDGSQQWLMVHSWFKRPAYSIPLERAVACLYCSSAGILCMPKHYDLSVLFHVALLWRTPLYSYSYHTNKVTALLPQWPRTWLRRFALRQVTNTSIIYTGTCNKKTVVCVLVFVTWISPKGETL